MKRIFLCVALLTGIGTFAQPQFSLVTGVSGLRNFTPRQTFWALGQSVQANFHFAPRETAYASMEYYTEGKFKNNFIATAKASSATPQQIAFTATGRLRYRQISLGWIHYFKGSFSGTDRVSVYGLAGFGYLFSKATNSASPAFDTAGYNSPLVFGEGSVKRLSFDAGAGAESYLGGSVYAFVQARTWLPASYQPSPYLHNSDRLPLALAVGVGVRVLFDFVY